MKIHKNYLVLIAGIFWLIAGFFIMKIGVPLFINIIKNSTILMKIASIIFSILVFCVFFKFIFYKLVKKHTVRIRDNQGIHMEIWKFFDLKSYIIMIFMMTIGILGRKLSLFPIWFIGTFYTGLGLALFLAGVGFVEKFIKKEVLLN